MNTTQLKGDWQQVMGKAKQYWGKLTDDDLRVIEGKHDELVGKLVARYGIAKEEAEKQVEQFNKSVN